MKNHCYTAYISGISDWFTSYTEDGAYNMAKEFLIQNHMEEKIKDITVHETTDKFM